MAFYQFADISHHKGDVDIQVFASAGHRIVISKASDNYHLPDKNGQYDFPAERHFDSRFVDNFTNTRAAGLVAGAYHFCRFDRPKPVNNRAAIVQANLTYFQTAIAMLPPEYQDTVQTAILRVVVVRPVADDCRNGVDGGTRRGVGAGIHHPDRE